MRERNRDKGRLEDIVFYSNNVKTILDGVSYEDFVNDIRIYYSVILKSASNLNGNLNCSKELEHYAS